MACALIEPDSGALASAGEHGIGRLAEPERLLVACEQTLAAGAPRARGGAQATGLAGRTLEKAASHARGGDGPADWAGVRVLVTAGGTREPIDSVRFIGNSSSGAWALRLPAPRAGAAPR